VWARLVYYVVGRIMVADIRGPQDGFKSFLEKAEADGWIASYKWVGADSFGLLRQKLGGKKTSDEISRTHKKGTDGRWWSCEVEAHYGTSVGVDLELLISRPILEDPTWICNRLNLPRNLSPKNLLEEWTSREAAFKSLAPDNKGLKISQFRKSGTGSYTIFTPNGEKSMQVRSATNGKWILTLAWRSLT
jgi:hypothetical protein